MVAECLSGSHWTSSIAPANIGEGSFSCHLPLLDSLSKTFGAVRAFDWLKVTAGYLDDDHACMVRVKFDEVYVSRALNIFIYSYLLLHI